MRADKFAGAVMLFFERGVRSMTCAGVLMPVDEVRWLVSRYMSR